MAVLVGLGMSSCSKYKYEKVEGDLSGTRIQTYIAGK